MKKTAVVTTTIRVPEMLDATCKNAQKNKHENIEFFVIGDKKTPENVSEYCEKLSSKYNYPVHYLDIDDQEETLGDYPELLGLVPYNDACRKIFGMVIAYMQGFETLIMLDDDNHPTDHDFFKYHGIVGTEQNIPLVESETGWFNACDYLIEENNMPFYYRGFPWSQRKIVKSKISIKKADAKIAVTSGFWLDDPDVDATTRLYWPVNAVGMKKEMEPNFGLAPGTWCPFNNQNTGMARDVLPGYFTPYAALRFSDLFPAFVICRLAEHMGHVISYGYPFVRQLRNPHNLWDDVKLEITGAQATEALIELLRSAKLKEKNYHGCLGELNKHFDKNQKIVENLPKDQCDMLSRFFKDLEIYHEVFKSIHKENKIELTC